VGDRGKGKCTVLNVTAAPKPSDFHDSCYECTGAGEGFQCIFSSFHLFIFSGTERCKSSDYAPTSGVCSDDAPNAEGYCPNKSSQCCYSCIFEGRQCWNANTNSCDEQVDRVCPTGIIGDTAQCNLQPTDPEWSTSSTPGFASYTKCRNCTEAGQGFLSSRDNGCQAQDHSQGSCAEGPRAQGYCRNVSTGCSDACNFARGQWHDTTGECA
jgi:hypothetical protein